MPSSVYAVLTGERVPSSAMRKTAAIILATVLVTVLAALAATPAGGSTAAYRTPASRVMRTAVYFPLRALSSSEQDLYLRKIQAAGAWGVRISLLWDAVAPTTRPSNFNPSDPADPAYRWKIPDELIAAARAHGLEPLVTVWGAPTWAGGRGVSPTQLGQFARAAARRYSGSFHGLPRVRYWLLWNEPNLHKYLDPQYAHHRVVSAVRYRKMINAFATPVHSVHRDNVVVAGELAPLDTPTSPGAMKFTRAALCVSAKLRSTCRTHLHFDIWSTHPYTTGGPTHKAHGPDGVALGNLPQLRRLVQAAVRLHHVSSSGHVGVWATEFSWNSRPPTRTGVPMRLEARWVAEALYRVWATHVGLLTWFQLVDDPYPSLLRGGLYFRGKSLAKARPKPLLTAFRFPFVAFKHGSHVYVWGRTPDSRRHWTSIELKAHGHRWSAIAKLRANASGIFFRTFNLQHSKTSWSLRARLSGRRTHSIGFSLRHVPDRPYPPFGP
jgi:hypothetical protein